MFISSQTISVDNIFTIDTHQPTCIFNFVQALQKIICVGEEKQNIVFLCIGTDRSTGDALGPLIGTKISAISRHSMVYGTLSDPVHAKNLAVTLSHIKQTVPMPLIIAIDACLGKSEHIGHITLGRGPLKPGTAVNKNLPSVGDFSITGVVNVAGFMEQLVLQSTRLNLVMKMADIIACALSLWIKTQPITSININKNN